MLRNSKSKIHFSHKTNYSPVIKLFVASVCGLSNSKSVPASNQK